MGWGSNLDFGELHEELYRTEDRFDGIQEGGLQGGSC